MSAPTYQPQGYPQPQYPAQQPGFPPQYAPQAQPQQYAPQPAYAPPPMPGYPPVQMAQPAAPLAQGSIDDFFNQPSGGGGAALKFPNQAFGTRYIGIVTRPLGPGDVQQQTDTQQRPQFFKDGRPKFVMKVPLQMQPSAAYPDGIAQWYVKGAARDELVRAMSEAGAPAGPPEAGSIIDVTYVSDRQAGVGMNPAKQFRVVYTRPDGAAGVVPAAPAQPAAPAPQAPAQPVQQFQPPAAPPQPDPAAQALAQAQQYQQQAPAASPAAPAQPQAPAAPAAQMQVPAGLSPEQQQLMAQLAKAQQG